ncbi:hypothetical protein M407DRAFT_167216 [Tulasnella calospora MUT 4182]|uniref:Uncharacterized protein n=1 Tax=Tulasnella calospora MUT 4182 TaxID=1051891 RepID=A0A0C3QQ28_9AGAM|nr:hypothetical protein M407DRAFT_167216 [Tulasnella calospora MUT 4182]
MSIQYFPFRRLCGYWSMDRPKSLYLLRELFIVSDLFCFVHHLFINGNAVLVQQSFGFRYPLSNKLHTEENNQQQKYPEPMNSSSLRWGGQPRKMEIA